ncbi:TrkA family potassium uptake protein [Marispirochaeta aestuarii]|uniref:potassium channel family protein n=1 Tax=Marispirochaeta aestuarii TaxID=1963862 RepID=UPI0029C92A37|nr:TrkA family potassium uptake protein [Marispirochaeta aestuarii]
MAKDTGKNYLVVGLGSFGSRLCEVLEEKGGTVIAVDADELLIERIKNSVTQAVHLDSTDESRMSELDLEDVDVGIVAIGNSFEASILTTAIMKRLGVPYIIARSLTELHHQVLLQVGADEIVNVEIDEGTRLANRLIAPDILDRIPLSGEISVAEVRVPKGFVEKQLIELDLRKRLQINVIAIRRYSYGVDEIGNPTKSESLIFPGGEEVLQEEDILLIVGRNENISSFNELQE